MKSKLWITSTCVVLILVVAILYYSKDVPKETTSDIEPTPTHAVPDGADVVRWRPTVTEGPTATPTPTTVVSEPVSREVFLLSVEEEGAPVTEVEIAFPTRDYLELALSRIANPEQNETWEAVYHFSGYCTNAIVRYGEDKLTEIIGTERNSSATYLYNVGGTEFMQGEDRVATEHATDDESELILFVNRDRIRLCHGDLVLLEAQASSTGVLVSGLPENEARFDASFFEENEKLDPYYLIIGEETTRCIERATNEVVWSMETYYQDAHVYHVEMRMPSEEDPEQTVMKTVYEGEHGRFPEILEGMDDPETTILEAMKKPEANADKPKKEWETTAVTAKVFAGEIGTISVETTFCGCYRMADGNLVPDVTITERKLRFEKPEWHLLLEDTIADPDSKIVKTRQTELSDKGTLTEYFLQTYQPSADSRHSRALSQDGELLWTEESGAIEGEGYAEHRTYPDHIMDTYYYQNNLPYAQEVRELDDTIIQRTEFRYDASRALIRKEVFDKYDIRIETYEYTYDADGKLLYYVRTKYNQDGDLTGTERYDANGKLIVDTD